jgi:CelD/BcsL family acetyltransferase involved in cellulose biosynthesis
VSPAPVERLTFATISDVERFAAVRDEWDALVRSMPRPSPFLLNDWLSQWWRHYGDTGSPRVEVALRADRLVAALPLFVRSYAGVRVASFLGARGSALADLLLADREPLSTGRMLAARAGASGFAMADLFGLPADSRLAAAAPGALSLIERVEAPVLDIDPSWNAVYEAKTSSKQRALHRRRRRQLGALGTVEVAVARTPDELALALQDAVRLHALRRAGRPDGSGFASPTGMRFHRDAIRALARSDVPRIVLLKLDGRSIAFHYYFALCGRMYVHRLAFDPAFAQYSPGLVNTLDAIAAAAAEGLTRVEFLGGAERYKLQLADRLEPLYQGVGMARGVVGRALVRQRLGVTWSRTRLKRSERLHRVYLDGLAPVRRAVRRVHPPRYRG